MKKHNNNSNDPFAEYDKFWDDYDGLKEVKSDEDYFKDKQELEKKYRNNDMKDKDVQKRVRMIIIVMFLFFFLIVLMPLMFNSKFNIIIIGVVMLILIGLIMSGNAKNIK